MIERLILLGHVRVYTIKPMTAPKFSAIVLTAVAVVRTDGSNHVADNNDGAAVANGPVSSEPKE
jgi:hypothetical protein